MHLTSALRSRTKNMALRLFKALQYSCSLLFVVLGIGFTLLGTVVNAYAEPVRLVNIRILDEARRRYDVGQIFRLNVDSKTLGSAGGAESIKARIFRGTRNDYINRKLGQGVGNECVAFSSKIYDVSNYWGRLSFDFDFDVAWLEVNDNGNNIADQVYVLFFEQSGKNSEMLLIDNNSIAGYFNKGYEFVVSARLKQSSSSVKNAIDKRTAAKKEIETEYKELVSRSGRHHCRYLAELDLFGDRISILLPCEDATGSRLDLATQ